MSFRVDDLMVNIASHSAPGFGDMGSLQLGQTPVPVPVAPGCTFTCTCTLITCAVFTCGCTAACTVTCSGAVSCGCTNLGTFVEAPHEDGQYALGPVGLAILQQQLQQQLARTNMLDGLEMKH